MCRRRALAKAWRKQLAPASAQAITRVAAKLEPALRKRFLAAVASLKGRVDLEALAAAMQHREAIEAITALHPETWERTLTPVARILPQAFNQAGKVAATILSGQLQTEMSFNLTNPRAVQWARTNTARLIVEVGESVKESVRGVIGSAFTEGMHPYESARLIRDIVGLTDRQAQAVVNYRFDLLEAGRTPEDVARLADRYGRQLLNYRSKTISRTETLTSSAQGQSELWNQAIDRGLLDPDKTWRRWIVAEDDRLCDLCAPMNDQIVKYGDPFTRGDGVSVMTTPAHVNCRCAVSLSFIPPEDAA
jgi:hypothetical protein